MKKLLFTLACILAMHFTLTAQYCVENETLTPTTSWQTINGSITGYSNTYTYKFTAVEGEKYSFLTRCDGGANSSYPLDFSLYDSSCSSVSLGNSWDWECGGFRNWECPASGDYYFLVVNHVDNQNDYTLAYKSGTLSYTISTSAYPTIGGSVTGGGTFVYGTSHTITAVANPGYVFVGWTKQVDGILDTDTPTTKYIYLTQDINYVANFVQESKTYAISTAASPASGGSVSGNGSYNAGTYATLIATPNAGYAFTGKWNYAYSGKTKVSWDEIENDLFVNQNLTATAYFAPSTTITPTYEWQSVSGSTGNNEAYVYKFSAVQGEKYTFKIVNKDGYQVSSNIRFYNSRYSNSEWGNLTNWQCGSTGDYYLVIEDENFDYTVSYIAGDLKYTLTTIANPSEGGFVTGGGVYEPNKYIEIEATANDGYVFVGWSKTVGGEIYNTYDQLYFPINQDVTWVANFVDENTTFTLTTLSNPSAGGKIWVHDYDNYKGNYDSQNTYKVGSEIRLQAEVNEGYKFIGWSHTVGGDILENVSEYVSDIRLFQDTTFVANFVEQNYTLTVNSAPAAGGEVKVNGVVSSGGTYPANSRLEMEAVPNGGYFFTQWTIARDNYDYSYTEDYISFNFTLDEDCTVTAKFESCNSYDTEISPTTTWKEENSTLVDNIYRYKFTATKGEKYQFKTNCFYGSTAYLYIYNADCEQFASGRRLYECDNNYHYTYIRNWECPADGDYYVHLNAHYNSYNLEYNNFSLQYKKGEEIVPNYSLNISATEGGTVSLNVYDYETEHTIGRANGTYPEGSEVYIRSTPNPGYVFAGWTTTVGGELQHRYSDDMNIYLKEDISLIAVFESSDEMYTVTTNVSPANTGTVTGAGTYPVNTELTLRATSNAGYGFKYWIIKTDEYNTDRSSDNPYKYTLDRDITVTAYFETCGTYNATIVPNSTWQHTGGDISEIGIPDGFDYYIKSYKYKFTATQGEKYTFKTSFGDGASSGFSSWLHIYDNNCNIVADGDAAWGKGANISNWVCTASGDYIIEIQGSVWSDDDGNFVMAYKTGQTAVEYDYTLSSLTVDNGILTPAFSPHLIEYRLTIDEPVTSLNVNALATNPAAYVCVAHEDMNEEDFEFKTGSTSYTVPLDEYEEEYGIFIAVADNSDINKMENGRVYYIDVIRRVLSSVESVAEDKIHVYPNPTTEGFRMSGITASQTISIIDTSGRLMLQQQVSEGEYISTAHLSKGIYIVRVGDYATKLVVK